MKVPADEVEHSLKMLTATPRQIASMSRGIPEARLYAKPDKEAWSANEILAHLRACADVWGNTIRTMIAQDRPTLRYVSPRTWMRKTNYPEQGFHDSLSAFSQQRKELVATLKALKNADWLRGATFTATTKGRDQTIRSYVRRITDHEQVHLEQLQALLK